MVGEPPEGWPLVDGAMVGEIMVGIPAVVAEVITVGDPLAAGLGMIEVGGPAAALDGGGGKGAVIC
jgi:hypothetical protein